MTEDRKLPLVMKPTKITYEPFGKENADERMTADLYEAINDFARDNGIGVLVIAPGEFKTLQALADEADETCASWLAKAMNMLANHQRFPPNPPIGEPEPEKDHDRKKRAADA